MGGNIGAIAGVSSYNAGLLPLRNEEWASAADYFGGMIPYGFEQEEIPAKNV